MAILVTIFLHRFVWKVGCPATGSSRFSQVDNAIHHTSIAVYSTDGDFKMSLYYSTFFGLTFNIISCPKEEHKLVSHTTVHLIAWSLASSEKSSHC